MSQGGGNIPVLVLKEGTGRSTGREAQRNNIMAAKIVAETVKARSVHAAWIKCSSAAWATLQ